MPKLYLIPNTLGEKIDLQMYTNEVIAKVQTLNYYVAENEKNCRRMIKNLAPDILQANISIQTLNKNTSMETYAGLLNPIFDGHDLGLVSDAGAPGIADPGAELVKMAHFNGVSVVPMTGPSSILLALMASGLNGQSFSFHGYLPIDKKERKKIIKQLENKVYVHGQTQIFMETPYRNNQLIEDLLQICQPTTLLNIASNITMPNEKIKTQSIAAWKKEKINLHKQPAIFCIGI